MEFICEKKDIQAGVTTVEKIVSTRSTLPIIGNILFEASKNSLKLSANNLEIGIELGVKAVVVKEGAALLPAKTLSGIVSKLPETSVSFKMNENNNIRINYNQSHLNIHALPPDEFPSLPKVKEGKSISIRAKIFLSMIKQTIFAVSSNEEKYVLTGVLIEVGKSAIGGDNTTLRVIATDGYRLAKKGEKIGLGVNFDISAIIPAKALIELSRILENKEEEELKITIASDQITFQIDDVYMVSRLIQGQFPDYRQVIPKKSDLQIIMLTKELLEAAERAGVVASGSANVTKFEVKNGKMNLSANTPDIGNIDEAIKAEIKGGDKATASFNIRLIIDALKVMPSEKIVFEMSEGLSPGVIKPEGAAEYIYIVMPIRTQGAS